MRVTVSAVTEAVIDTMRAANPGGIIDHALASRIGGEIRPALDRALKSKVGSGAELAGLSEFRTILSQHLSNPSSTYIEAEARKAIQRTLETANRTGSQFSTAASQARLGSFAAPGETARDDAGTEGRRGGERVAAAMAREAPLTVTGAISFARELGISPAYAGFFAGGSPEMRDALRGAIRDGTAITEDKVKSMRDVSAVLGAVRAGKLSADDPRIPSSVRGVMEDMKKNGIDPATADPKRIQRYLKDNPGALDTARQAAAHDAAALPPDQRHTSSDALERSKGALQSSPATAPKASSKLNLLKVGA